MSKNSALKIIPLGGLNEIGKNLTVFECEDDIIIVDCGISFPFDNMPGVDLVIPDMTYLLRNKEKIRAVIITHAHEDHIGAVGYLLRQIDVPIYGARLTLGLLEYRLKEMDLLKSSKLVQVNETTILTIGNFKVEFISVNHSIPDAFAVVITSPSGIIVHTGDFKIDYNPVNENVTNLNKFSEVGNRNVLLMLSDSTNAIKEGHSMSEQSVGESLDSFIRNAKSRILVASFASNIHRIQQVITLAEKYKRKVAIFGFNMRNNIKKAIELGYISVKQNTLIDENEIKNYKDKEIVFIVTGSQGEDNSALSRIAFKKHPKISIEKDDLVIISASVIPGNEKYLLIVINQLFKNGAKVIYQGLDEVHASGHAYKQELQLLLSLVRPKYYMPIHGEYMHLKANADIAMEMGIKEDRIFILENGDVMRIENKKVYIDEKVEAGISLIDGLGMGAMADDVIRDRIFMGQGGIINIIAVVDKTSKKLKSEPVIKTNGFVYEDEYKNVINIIEKLINIEFEKYQSSNMKVNELQNSIRKRLKSYLYLETRRSPMIIPTIIEI